MKSLKVVSSLFLLMVAFLFSACASKPVMTVEVVNPSDFDREVETVEVPLGDVLVALGEVSVVDLVVKEAGVDSVLLSQLIDNNSDGEFDAILFQTALLKNATKKFIILEKIGNEIIPITTIVTYARTVPERIDDFTWENDRIAFRMYGPEAQRLIETGDNSGVISNGIDCWLKRVKYSVIDKWYAGHVKAPGFYHKDSGEGVDNYHVGSSRGCGGIAVLKGDEVYSSKNYISSKVLANGPIRSVFELTYAAWDADGVELNETKKVTIDLGMSLNKFECSFSSDSLLPTIATGITMHNQLGVAAESKKDGWIRYWEPMPDESMLGTGVIVSSESLVKILKVEVEEADKSHIYAVVKPVDGTVVYHVGYGWNKAGFFDSVDEWDAYLTYYSNRLKTPVKVVY